MTARERFLKQLSKECRKQNIDFEIIKSQGKGSHYKVLANGKYSTVKHGDLTPQYMRLIKKQLGLK